MFIYPAKRIGDAHVQPKRLMWFQLAESSQLSTIAMSDMDGAPITHYHGLEAPLPAFCSAF